eukprot:71254-Chlamydomonas_euryale.AAC.7
MEGIKPQPPNECAARPVARAARTVCPCPALVVLHGSGGVPSRICAPNLRQCGRERSVSSQYADDAMAFLKGSHPITRFGDASRERMQSQSQSQSQSCRECTHDGYACVERIMTEKIRQRAGRCHKGHATVHGLEPPHTNPHPAKRDVRTL